MGDSKGDTTKKHQQKQQQLSSSSSPNDLEESPTDQSRQQQVTEASPAFLSAPLYSSSTFDQQFEVINPKRQRYGGAQWKFLPSPSSRQQLTQTQLGVLNNESSTPSPTTTNPTNLQLHSAAAAAAAAASSSEAASSPPQSPPPSTASDKPEAPEQFRQQLRKGKYVSPVWKPNEMLWLARAWRIQYQGGGEGGDNVAAGDTTVQHTRGKTRAEKDREVAEFLNIHGINRDAKTSGTKWDNMLGEFRKVYEWERGAEREQVGKSYFRLSPYERKLHRLPASFDEEVFEELSHFMGSKVRPSQSRVASAINLSGDENKTILASSRALPPPPPFKDEENPLSGRTKQLGMTSGGLFGYEPSTDIVGVEAFSSTSKELKRIGKIRMIWEESVSLWGEEGEHLRGRIRVQGSSFLNEDELVFFDDSMVACTMEAFEDGPLKGFSVDRFLNGQQVRVFGRRKSPSSSATAPPSSGFIERNHQFPLTELSMRSMPLLDFQDPTDYYVGCLQQSLSPVLPSLFELSWRLQEPPPEEYRLPLRKDVYKDLPPGKEMLFTTSNELLDSRGFVYEILGPIIRSNNPMVIASSRDSFIGIWEDCINRVVSKFCPADIVIVRKSSANSSETLQDQWPNVTGFVKNLCLWRGEETNQLREGQLDPSSSIIEKLLWSYMDLPYLLGYYAVGYTVTFCALSRSSQDRIIRTDLYSVDLSSPSDRLKALVPCYRIAGLLTLLADRCCINSNVSKQSVFSDFARIDLGNGNIIEMTPNTVIRSFSSKRKWAAVKEIYDILDHRIPHSEYIYRASEKDLLLVFKPRGHKFKPANFEQLVEALKFVTKALVALHDLSFMHRDLGWDRVLRRIDSENEWFVSGFDEAVGAPQIYPHGEERGRHAPEMGRGLHGVKVDVWGVGYLLKTCSLTNVPKILGELQNRCLEQNPEQRPTAADCYHHLLQVQSSLQPPAAGAPY